MINDLEKEKIKIDTFIYKTQYKRSLPLSRWIFKSKSSLFILITIICLLFIFEINSKIILGILFVLILFLYTRDTTKYFREDTKDVFLYRITKNIINNIRTRKKEKKKIYEN